MQLKHESPQINTRAYLQSMRKVFTALHLFHILSNYGLIPKCDSFFTSEIYSQYLIKTKWTKFAVMYENKRTKYNMCISIQPLWYSVTRLADIYVGSFFHSALQSLSCSIRLDGARRCAAIFRSCQRCSIGFKPGLWPGHSRTFTQWTWGHFFVLAVCLGWFSCQNMKLCPSLRSRVLWSCSFLHLFFSTLPVPASCHDGHHCAYYDLQCHWFFSVPFTFMLPLITTEFKGFHARDWNQGPCCDCAAPPNATIKDY